MNKLIAALMITAVCILSAQAQTYYLLKNQWQGQYLGDNSAGSVVYNGTPGSDTKYQWSFQSTGDGYYRIVNRSTGNKINIQPNTNDTLQVTGDMDDSYQSAMWSQVASGSYMRLQNRWQSDRVINVERQKGYAQCHNVSATFQSANWILENAPSGFTLTANASNCSITLSPPGGSYEPNTVVTFTAQGRCYDSILWGWKNDPVNG